MDRVVLSKIGQVAVLVGDLERAIAFYRDTLGLPFLFKVPGMAFFQAGSVRLMLGTAEGEMREGASSMIYYQVGDLERGFEELAARGVEVVQKPHLVARMEAHDLHMAFFHDSEGNLFALMSEVRRSAEELA